MKSKFFRIADVVFEVRSEIQIADCKFYKNYVSEPEKADVTLNVYYGSLPQRSGLLLQKYDNKAEYLSDGIKRVFSFNALNNIETDYTCAEFISEKSINIYVNRADYIHDTMVFGSINLPDILASFGKFLFHCSFITANGKTLLFSGNKGVGKSTQAELWRVYQNAEIVNGDRAVLSAESGRIIAYGTPYCGSSDISLNKSAAVSAIIFPEHGSSNELTRLKGGADIFTRIFSQITASPEYNEAKLSLIEAIVGTIPVYSFPCLPDETAVFAVRQELKI